jgi:pimeloyl-ACP methyl ester carboxylesterase
MRTDETSARGMWREIGHGPAIDRGAIPDVWFPWYSALLSSTATMQGVVDEARAIATPFGYRRGVALTEADLARIVVPTLYLWGDGDSFGTPAHAERLARATPGAVLERFPGFGHLPWMDDPAGIAERVVAFLGHGRENAARAASTSSRTQQPSR